MCAVEASLTIAIATGFPLFQVCRHSSDQQKDEMANSIKPASIADLETVERIVHDAYVKYTERMGKQPGPMLDDYRQRIQGIHARRAATLGLLVLDKALQVSDDFGVGKLLGGVLDAKLGEGATAVFRVVVYPEDTILGRHGHGELIEQLDADAEHFGGTFNRIDMIGSGHGQAAMATTGRRVFQFHGSSSSSLLAG